MGASGESSGFGTGNAPENFADVPNISAGCTSRCGCNVLQRIEETGGRPTPHIEQLALDGRTGNGKRSWPWSGTIHIDPANKQITVTTNMLAINKTAKRLPGYGSYSANELGDDEFRLRASRIPGAIKSWWNAKPYRIRITTAECGTQNFRIMFNPRIYFQTSEISGRKHYDAEIYNVSELNFSEVSSTRKILRLNISQQSTGTDRDSYDSPTAHTDTLEAHEYGHMIGIRDLYYISERRINGASFRFTGDGSGLTELHNDVGIGAISGTSPDAGPHIVRLRSGGTSHGCLMGSAFITGVYPRGYMLPLGHVIQQVTPYKIEAGRSYEVYSCTLRYHPYSLHSGNSKNVSRKPYQ